MGFSGGRGEKDVFGEEILETSVWMVVKFHCCQHRN